MSFQFLDPGSLIDRELQLIVPEARWTNEVLRTSAHPLGRGDPTSKPRVCRSRIALRTPGGHFIRETSAGGVPQYLFWMRAYDLEYNPNIIIAGSISLRIGDSEGFAHVPGSYWLQRLAPRARGRHYAQRKPANSCSALPAGMDWESELWITCNPDNIASRKTQSDSAAEHVETVSLPRDHVLYQRGESEKCRYRIDLEERRWIVDSRQSAVKHRHRYPSSSINDPGLDARRVYADRTPRRDWHYRRTDRRCCSPALDAQENRPRLLNALHSFDRSESRLTATRSTIGARCRVGSGLASLRRQTAPATIVRVLMDWSNCKASSPSRLHRFTTARVFQRNIDQLFHGCSMEQCLRAQFHEIQRYPAGVAIRTQRRLHASDPISAAVWHRWRNPRRLQYKDDATQEAVALCR